MQGDSREGKPRKISIFYSWQRDLPNPTNRGLIGDALKKVEKTLRNDATVRVEPEIERDTQGVSGAPDIAQTIFNKILTTDILVADVSIISGPRPRKGKRAVPNPNVLVELGYAVGCHGWHKVIMVANIAYGALSLLPFDLKQRRVLPYSLKEAEQERAPIRNQLTKALEGRIRECIRTIEVNDKTGRPHEHHEVDDVIDGLRSRTLAHRSGTYTLDRILVVIGATIAAGATEREVIDACHAAYGFPSPVWDPKMRPEVIPMDILGPLLIYDVAEIRESQSEEFPSSPRYHLTELGRHVMRRLDRLVTGRAT